MFNWIVKLCIRVHDIWMERLMSEPVNQPPIPNKPPVQFPPPRIDYASIGRELLVVDQLPQGAFARYENGAPKNRPSDDAVSALALGSHVFDQGDGTFGDNNSLTFQNGSEITISDGWRLVSNPSEQTVPQQQGQYTTGTTYSFGYQMAGGSASGLFGSFVEPLDTDRIKKEVEEKARKELAEEQAKEAEEARNEAKSRKFTNPINELELPELGE